MTEPATQTLDVFLLARIDEDQAVAADAAAEVAAVWHALEYAYEGIGVSPGPLYEGDGYAAGVSTSNSDVTATTEQITRWSPARVIAECEMKRGIVDRIAGSWTWDYVGRANYINHDHVLRLLAKPYADDPDFREEWAL